MKLSPQKLEATVRWKFRTLDFCCFWLRPCDGHVDGRAIAYSALRICCRALKTYSQRDCIFCSLRLFAGYLSAANLVVGTDWVYRYAGGFTGAVSDYSAEQCDVMSFWRRTPPARASLTPSVAEFFRISATDQRASLNDGTPHMTSLCVLCCLHHQM